MPKSPEMGNGSPENEPRTLDDIEKSVLQNKHNGLPDSTIIKGLENPPSGKQGYSKEEIEQAFQRLRDYGFIDENGLVTEEGIDYLENTDV